MSNNSSKNQTSNGLTSEKPTKNTNSIEPFSGLATVKSFEHKNSYLDSKWSPSGNLIMATTNGYNDIIILDGNGNVKDEIKGTRIGYGAIWKSDTEILYKTKENFKLIAKSYSLTTKESVDLENVDPNDLNSAENDLYVFTNTNTLKIEAKDKASNKSWVVTPEDGQYYQAILSPSKDRVLVHNGSKMEVYAFDGSGLIKSLTDGIATSWFPDGKKVLFFLDESLDGHGVSNSDIFIVDVETNEITNLTNTPDVLEMYPSLSPNGKQITYTNSETGVLIIADLK